LEKTGLFPVDKNTSTNIILPVSLSFYHIIIIDIFKGNL
jgi:hypothetical protein